MPFRLNSKSSRGRGSLALTPERRTGVDESTLILLEFPKLVPFGKTKAHAVATTAMRASDDPARGHEGKGNEEVPAARIRGEKGEIQVYGPIFRDMRYRRTRMPRSWIRYCI